MKSVDIENKMKLKDLTKDMTKDQILEALDLKEKVSDNMEYEDYLKYLLCEDIIFINNGWWDENWPKDKVTLHVGCNDVFAWGCADAEDIDYSDLETLYNSVRRDPVWGAAIWCIVKRKQWPQKPVEEQIRKTRLHDLDKLLEGVKK